eukprot:scaffold44582_cov18-Tisochrysis_lutea.AAC.3
MHAKVGGAGLLQAHIEFDGSKFSDAIASTQHLFCVAQLQLRAACRSHQVPCAMRVCSCSVVQLVGVIRCLMLCVCAPVGDVQLVGAIERFVPYVCTCSGVRLIGAIKCLVLCVCAPASDVQLIGAIKCLVLCVCAPAGGVQLIGAIKCLVPCVCVCVHLQVMCSFLEPEEVGRCWHLSCLAELLLKTARSNSPLYDSLGTKLAMNLTKSGIVCSDACTDIWHAYKLHCAC